MPTNPANVRWVWYIEAHHVGTPACGPVRIPYAFESTSTTDSDTSCERAAPGLPAIKFRHTVVITRNARYRVPAGSSGSKAGVMDEGRRGHKRSPRYAVPLLFLTL